MKKFILSLLLAASASLAISSCTEETITPRDGESGDPCQWGCK